MDKPRNNNASAADATELNHEASQAFVLARALGDALQQRGLRVATIESCTGGLLSAAITSVAGSSGWFADGAISYSNAAKQRFAGVDPAILEREGAVSEAAVLAMATGFKAVAGADMAVAVSGIAGPGGATAAKPLGTVWIGWAGPDAQLDATHHVFAGNRHDVRQAAVLAALRGTISRIVNGAFQRE